MRLIPWMTTYTDRHGARHEAVQIPWIIVTGVLGRQHDGSEQDDLELMEEIEAAATTDDRVPEWLTTPSACEAWTDAAGYGLIGPAIDEE